MRRLLLLFGVVMAVGGVRHAPGWLATARTPPPTTSKPAGAIEYLELNDGSSIALFDNRLEVRGPAMGDLGFQRIYLDEIRSVEAKDTIVEVETDDAVVSLGLGSRVAVVALVSRVEKARARIAGH